MSDERIAAGIDAVSRAVYDLAQDHISPLGVNVGVSANGILRLSLTEAVTIALNAADEAAAFAPPADKPENATKEAK